MLRASAGATQRGWRHLLHRASFGKLSLGPSPAELRARNLAARVKAPIQGSRRIAVISRKGGVGKTTTTLMLGHTFASRRGDRVVALDANPDAGSLGYRVRRETSQTVTDLLADADAISRYADIRSFTSQANTRLEVVASDHDPQITQALGEADYHRAVELLDRHYTMILLDTGTGILDSAIQGVLKEADQIVLVIPPALDGARVAASTLDWLDSHGFEQLVTSAVAVINSVRKNGLVEVERVEQHFLRRCAATVRIPFDQHLEAGAVSTLDELRPATRDAYLELAALVADQFTEPDRDATRRHRP
jgi:putative peptide zinc metalloprotease protein